MEERREENKKIATTILEQLGGNKFIAMTGSKNFTVINYGLSMKLSRNNSKANYLDITLNCKDLYDMKFKRVTGGKVNKKFEYVPLKIEIVKEYNDVFNDMLEGIFTEITGMYTRLF